MSYDFHLIKLNRSIAKIEDLEVSDLAPLGSVVELQAKIVAVVPDVVWHRFGEGPDSFVWGRVERPAEGVSMQIDFDTEHQRFITIKSGLTPGNRAIFDRLCAAYGWTLWDLQTNTLHG